VGGYLDVFMEFELPNQEGRARQAFLGRGLSEKGTTMFVGTLAKSCVRTLMEPHIAEGCGGLWG